MGLWTMITVIVVVSVLGGIISDYLKHRTKAVAANMDEYEARLNKMNKEMDALKQRIRNLETIAVAEPSDLVMDVDEDFGSETDEAFNEKLINQLAKKKKTR